MNSRERMLLIVFLSVLVGGGGLFVFIEWFVKPLKDLNKQIEEATAAYDTVAKQYDDYLVDRKKLELARRKSLPGKREQAAAEYMSYLERIFKDAGMSAPEITPSQNTIPVKLVTPIPNVKMTGHQLMTFIVISRGELKGLMRVMEAIQQTAYEHRIKTLTVDRESTSTARDAGSMLKVNMTIETLLVAGSRGAPGSPPGVDPMCLAVDAFAGRFGIPVQGWGTLASLSIVKQAMPVPFERNYDQVTKKNIFVGYLPPPPKRDPPSGPSPPDEDVPKYIRLVMTVPGENTAFLRNRVYDKSGTEIKVIAKARSGYETFRVADEDGEFVFFQAKVLRVEPRDVYFQVRHTKDVYALHIGDSLADALKYDPLSIERLDDLELEYDAEWAKAARPTFTRGQPSAKDESVEKTPPKSKDQERKKGGPGTGKTNQKKGNPKGE